MGSLAAPLQVVGRETTRTLLRAYLGRRSADKVLSGSICRGTGEMIQAVIWISDLRDFTRLSEISVPAQVIITLNDCCARLVGAIHPFGGEVLKFISDGLLADGRNFVFLVRSGLPHKSMKFAGGISLPSNAFPQAGRQPPNMPDPGEYLDASNQFISMALIFSGEASLTITPEYCALLEEYHAMPAQSFRI